ncbi:MAG: hypothetical protein KDD70_18660, partial [Bdellovibrionales bacterium]|nr:hypothetical protein [Bdellovibrionales bacterium]
KSGRAEPRELRRLRSMLRKPNLPRHVRDRTYARLRGYLTRRYFEDRMAVLSNSPVVNDFTLLVLGSPEELYRDFLEPFGGDRRLPSLRSFVGEFKGLLKAVSDVRRKAA